MTIRIDLSHMIPGLIVFLVGIVLFFVWVVLAFFSFFLFFVPALHGFFYFTLDVLIASIVLIAGGLVMMMAATSGWTKNDDRSWWVRPSRRLAAKDRLTWGERIGELFGLLVSILVLLFFIENQLVDTGFFTSRFGFVEELAFYGAWFAGVVINLARAVIGRKNAVRPLVVVQSGILAVSAFWLLLVFPFEFSHLADLLPYAVRFAFFWVSNPVGWLILFVTGVAGVISFLYNGATYFTVRARLQSDPFDRSSLM